MFSAADVQDIIRSVPPERTPSQNDSLPSLLLSSTGQGFVATDYVLQNFERMVTSSGKGVHITFAFFYSSK